jgi:hypothetical protein
LPVRGREPWQSEFGTDLPPANSASRPLQLHKLSIANNRSSPITVRKLLTQSTLVVARVYGRFFCYRGNNSQSD